MDTTPRGVWQNEFGKAELLWELRDLEFEDTSTEYGT